MSEDKKIKPEDNAANMQNSNANTPGVNDQFKANQDNRANQLNPNNPEYKGKKKK